ncbi:MAG: hypothetical protein AB7I19_10270 [Planctomycetota bacterium]
MRAIVLSIVAAAPVMAQSPVVSPSYFTNHEAYLGSGLPFGADGSAVSGTRFQQFHTDLHGAPRTISAIALRADQSGARREGAAMTVDLEVRIGASSLAAASTNFAANYSSAPTVAMSRRMMNLPARTGDATAFLGPFDVVLPFDQPFAYDGSTDLVWETITRSQVNYFTVRYASDYVVPQVNAGTVATGFAVRSLGGSTCTNYDLVPSGGLQTGASPNLIFGLQAKAHRSLVGTPVGIGIGISDPNFPLASALCTGFIHTDAMIAVGGPLNNAGLFTLGLVLPWQPHWAGLELFSQAVFLRSGGVAISRGLVVRLPDAVPPVAGNATLFGYGVDLASGFFVDHQRQLVVRFDP